MNRPTTAGRPRRARGRRVRLREGVALAALILGAGMGAAGLGAQAPPIEPLDDPEPLELEVMLERTILQVDVLRLTLRIGGTAGDRLEAFAGRELNAAARDSAVAIAMGAPDVWAHQRYLRDISIDQFVGGVLGNLRSAVEARVMPRSAYRDIADEIRSWYTFMPEGRGIRKGDEVFYRMHGDRARTVYRFADGTVGLDRIDTRGVRRWSVLAGYFGPSGGLREALLDALETKR